MNEERMVVSKWKVRNNVTEKNCSPGRPIKHMVLLQIIYKFGCSGQIVDSLNTCSPVVLGEPLGLCPLCQVGTLCPACRSPFPLMAEPGTWLDHPASLESTCSNFWGETEYMYVPGECRGKSIHGSSSRSCEALLCSRVLFSLVKSKLSKTSRGYDYNPHKDKRC